MAWPRVIAIVIAAMLSTATAQIPSMEVLGQWMRIAARAGDANYIQGLIDFGVPVDLQDPNGFTSLMWGAYYGRFEVVELLLDSGANPDHQNNKGDTSLMWASLGGYLDVVIDLIDHGADPDIQEQDGWSALMGAAVQGHYHVVEYLLDEGANKTIENHLGHAALTLASAMDNWDVVELLGDFEHIDHQDFKEMTPLHHAAASNHSLSLAKILEFCPNHTITDELNMTAMEWAEQIGFTLGVQMIEDYIYAKCKRHNKNYEVGDIIYQNCEALVCHCTGRWRLTGIRDELCGQRKNIVLSRQRHYVHGCPQTSAC